MELKTMWSVSVSSSATSRLFQAAAKEMQQQVVKLDAAAKGGNLDAIKTAFGATAKACKSCHDAFRNR
mgnify:CR=1 FL=1